MTRLRDLALCLALLWPALFALHGAGVEYVGGATATGGWTYIEDADTQATTITDTHDPSIGTTWTDVDLTKDGVPATATRALVRVHWSKNATKELFFRPNGSSDAQSDNNSVAYSNSSGATVNVERSVPLVAGVFEASWNNTVTLTQQHWEVVAYQ